MSWYRHFRGTHTDTAMILFQALKRDAPECYFITEETIVAKDEYGKEYDFQVDFLFKEVNLIVEPDGEEVHDHSDIQRAKTLRKKVALEKEGYTVFNYPNQRIIKDCDNVVKEIKEFYENKMKIIIAKRKPTSHIRIWK